MNTQELENKLSPDMFKQWLDALTRVRAGKNWSAPDKNHEIKAKFSDEFKELAGDNAAVKCRYSAANTEFLYDFSVMEWEKTADAPFGRTLLAMELEFSDDKMRKGWERGIKFDFHKLLQADAPHKVLVFHMKTGEKIEEAFDALENAAHAYKARCASQILLCAWNYSKSRTLHCRELKMAAR
ncbi:MAG: hypothetical protein OD918_02475 [Gammaproteobacteria bacterium]